MYQFWLQESHISDYLLDMNQKRNINAWSAAKFAELSLPMYANLPAELVINHLVEKDILPVESLGGVLLEDALRRDPVLLAQLLPELEPDLG